jgi:imidazolonepropionase-like amidohydrolase
MPCAAIDETLLQSAVDKGVTFVTTSDTLSSCVNTTTFKGIHSNTMSLASKGAKFIYGSEVAHDNVPWGINGEEMHMILHVTSGETVEYNEVINVFKSVTSEARKNLGIPKLGTVVAGAPADIIAVKGNPIERFKLLEYPDLVISGGQVVVNKYVK